MLLFHLIIDRLVRIGTGVMMMMMMMIENKFKKFKDYPLGLTPVRI